MKKTILVVQELFKEQIEELKEKVTQYDIVQSLDEAHAESIEIILGWDDQLTAFIESDKSNVKWIQYPYAGVNKLPLKLFHDKDIILTSGSGIHRHAVTETTMGLLLGLTRNIVSSAKNQAQEIWDKHKSIYDLKDKTMIIVGAGKIGVQLGRVAQAFDMETIGINRSGNPIDNMDEQYTQDELKEVIGKGDIVVNILPLTEETKYLFDAEMFSEMKDGVIFINVGRGESVDTDALINALNNGKVSRAGLDVFEEEPLPSGHPIWTHEKVLLTPHIAGNVESYPKYIYPLFVENLKAFQNNEELPYNVVELESGY